MAENNSELPGKLPLEAKTSELVKEKEIEQERGIENTKITATDQIPKETFVLPDTLGFDPPSNEDLEGLLLAFQTRIAPVDAGHVKVFQALYWVQRSLESKDKKREAELISLVISQLELLQELNGSNQKSSGNFFMDPVEKETILKQCQGVLLEAQGKLCEAMKVYMDALQIQKVCQLYPTTDSGSGGDGGFPFKTQALISRCFVAQEGNIKIEREATDGISPQLIAEMKEEQQIAKDLKLEGETEVALEVLKILLQKQNQVYCEDHVDVQETKKEIKSIQDLLEFQKNLIVDEISLADAQEMELN